MILVTLSIYLLTSSGRLRVIDEYMTYFQTQSLAERGSLSVPQAPGLGIWYGRAGQDGQPYAPYGPAHAAALVPGYWLGQALAGLPGVPEESADLVTALGPVFFSGLFGALLVGLLFRFLLELGLSTGLALLLSGGLAFGTLLWPTTGTLYSEPLSALFLLAGAFCLLRGTAGESIRLAPVTLAGLWLGAAILTRPSHGIAVPAFALGLLCGGGNLGDRLRGVVAFGAAASLGVAATLVLNQHTYGDMLQFGYPDHAEGGKALNGFETPMWKGLVGFLVSPGKSVFLFAPLLLIALVGLGTLARRHRALTIAGVGTAVTYLFFFSRYTQFEGGYCYGPRYLLPVVPLLLLGLAAPLALLVRGPRLLLVLVLLAGVAIQVPGVFTSFLGDQRGADLYYDDRHDYRLSHNPVMAQGKLLWRYGNEALEGRALESPLGQGLDLWPLFLHKGGVPWGPLVGILLAQLALLVVGLGCLLGRSAEREGDQDAGAARDHLEA